MSGYELSWKTIFQIIALSLLEGTQPYEILDTLGDNIGSRTLSKRDEEDKRYTFTVLDLEIQKVLDQLTSYGLVTSIEAERSYNGNGPLGGGTQSFAKFLLTEKGKRYRAFLNLNVDAGNDV